MTLSSQLTDLLLKQEIAEVLTQYCAAVDDLDIALLRSVFHPGATVDYGSLFAGAAGEFCDWAMGFLQGMDSTFHTVGNVLIRVEGQVAISRSCFTAWHFTKDESGSPLELLAGGRYLDRFEFRFERWRITDRRAVTIWSQLVPYDANSAKRVENRRMESTAPASISDGKAR